MAKGKARTSESYKRYYSNYNYEAQRRKRLQRHLKNQPNDEQAQEALKNLNFRGPKPSGQKGGWVTREMGLDGFYDKKGPHLDGINSKTLAWMKSIMRKSEAQRQHEQNFKSKEERKKGGNAKRA